MSQFSDNLPASLISSDTHPNQTFLIFFSYHRVGVYKWEEMQLPYPLEGMTAPSDECLARVTRLFESEGVEVIV